MNFIATLVLDGKERNVLNYWYNKNVDAGDDVCFRLKPMPIPQNGYTLNLYFKGFARQDFRSVFENDGGVLRNRTTHVWQLVPDVFSLEVKDEFDAAMVMPNHMLRVPQPFYWQEWGFWHIGRTQLRASKYSTVGDYYNDDMAFNLRLGHFDMTFSPCWNKVPGLPRAVRDGYKQDHTVVPHINVARVLPPTTTFLGSLMTLQAPVALVVPPMIVTPPPPDTQPKKKHKTALLEGLGKPQKKQ